MKLLKKLISLYIELALVDSNKLNPNYNPGQLKLKLADILYTLQEQSLKLQRKSAFIMLSNMDLSQMMKNIFHMSHS